MEADEAPPSQARSGVRIAAAATCGLLGVAGFFAASSRPTSANREAIIDAFEGFDSSMSHQELHRRLRELPASNPAHLCVTGDRARHFVEEVLLPDGAGLREFQMPSAQRPERTCWGLEHAVGHSLITVVPEIQDRCAGRFKVHSASCDFLIHAHAGSDCHELHKLRSVADHPDAKFMVMHQDQSLVQCFAEKMRERRKRITDEHFMPHHTIPRIPTRQDGGLARAAIANWLGVNRRPEVAAAFAATASAAEAEHHFDQPQLIRPRLVQAGGLHPKVKDLDLEILKHVQGYQNDLPSAMNSRGGGGASSRRLGAVNNIVMIDLGSFEIKMGRPEQDFPHRFRSMVGLPMTGARTLGTAVVGEDSKRCPQDLNITFPIEDGLVVEGMENEAAILLEYGMKNKMGLSRLDDLELVITHQGPITRDKWEKTAEILLNRLGVLDIYSGNAELLAFLGAVHIAEQRQALWREATMGYSMVEGATRTEAMVVSSGHTTSSIVPIVESYALVHKSYMVPLAGKELTEYANEDLRGLAPRMVLDDTENETARRFKETLGFVYDYASAYRMMMAAVARNYTQLPSIRFRVDSKQSVNVSFERYSVGERLFQPQVASDQFTPKEGIAIRTGMVLSELSKEDFTPIASRVIMNGGTTRLAGFKKRLDMAIENEISAHATANHIHVHEYMDANLLTWFGIQAALSLPPSEEGGEKESEGMPGVPFR